MSARSVAAAGSAEVFFLGNDMFSYWQLRVHLRGSRIEMRIDIDGAGPSFCALNVFSSNSDLFCWFTVILCLLDLFWET